MALATLVATAFGLAMDAVAVAIVTSLRTPRVGAGQVLGMALCFGAFQTLMPLLGWVVGEVAGPFLRAIDHWVAFAILAAIGGKMLYEACRPAAAPTPAAWPGLRGLLLLGLATSIDAAAAGISLSLLDLPLLLSVLVIGAVTALLTALGAGLGKRLGQRWGAAAEALGGVVLIALGVKMVGDHLGWW